MKRTIWVIALAVPVYAAAPDIPAQAARGQELFMTTAKPVACATCHELGGKGTAVGPDLKTWARVPPRAIAMAVTATVTEKVVQVKPKEGEAFPAIKVSEDGSTEKFYDLSTMPPSAREFPKDDVKITPNSSWKHPAGTEKMTAEQLADIISYIRWVGARDRRGVKPDEVE